MEKSLSVSEQPVALVTGASSGIGAAYARALAAGGYWVILVGRNHPKLLAVQKETGGEILIADLATDLGLRALEYRVQSEDRLDFLVNNAGFGTAGKFWEASLTGQDAMHRVHVLGTMRLTGAALPRMVRRNPRQYRQCFECGRLDAHSGLNQLFRYQSLDEQLYRRPLAGAEKRP